jgi:ubiquinone/menaquinone biosynthesis C-methylase UbiE
MKFDQHFTNFTNERLEHWKSLADKPRTNSASAYHKRLEEIYGATVPNGMRVLEVGSMHGDLLAALKPSYGVGVDYCAEMVEHAQAKHADIKFVLADGHDLSAVQSEGKFDFIILSDLLNDVWDVQEIFAQLQRFCEPSTRIIINSYSRLWEFPLRMAEQLKLAHPTLYQNWLTVEDVSGLLNLAGFEMIRSTREVLLPLDIPVIGNIANRFLAKLPIFGSLCLTNLLIARPKMAATVENPSVSVIVPARNEAGNIPAVFDRVPRMGAYTELVFVEGHSRDNTWDAIQQEVQAHPEWRCKIMQQTGKGKGDAVRMGFAAASGDIVMILDSDLTMPPEDLPRYYEALKNNLAEFANGVRLVYPMDKDAMKFANLLGNKFFSFAFSWLLGQSIKDTLCGTKALWKKDYERIAANRAYFGEFDPFGDYDLIFGAAKLNLKIVDVPIRYRERTYGSTNIQRWSHGWLLLKMVAFAATRIKFV